MPAWATGAHVPSCASYCSVGFFSHIVTDRRIENMSALLQRQGIHDMQVVLFCCKNMQNSRLDAAPVVHHRSWVIVVWSEADLYKDSCVYPGGRWNTSWTRTSLVANSEFEHES